MQTIEDDENILSIYELCKMCFLEENFFIAYFEIQSLNLIYCDKDWNIKFQRERYQTIYS